MESVSNVEKEIDKVLYKFTALTDHTQETLTELVETLNNLQKELQTIADTEGDIAPTSTQTETINVHLKRIKDVIGQVASVHRDLHGTVSKVGKAIDKNFTSDFCNVANDALFDEPSKMTALNQVIVEHFLRQGMLDIADQLIAESHLDIPAEKKNPFTELNEILDALKRRNLRPALDWAQKHSQKLLEQNSMLEFKLHRLQFIEFHRQGPLMQQEIINYVREYLQPLAARHKSEIQTLMGSLLYLKTGLDNTAYSYFLDQANWCEISELFTRDACALLGLSIESPLRVAFNAGTIALPALLNIKRVMQQRKVTSVWTNKDELPVEIDLGRNCQFHSIFACPILRQQSGDSNPPMRLVCGHVISRDALYKLTNGSKLKCPYCPLEQNPADARLIHF